MEIVSLPRGVNLTFASTFNIRMTSLIKPQKLGKETDWRSAMILKVEALLSSDFAVERLHQDNSTKS